MIQAQEEQLMQLLQKELGYYHTVLELSWEVHKKLTQKATLKDILPIIKKQKILLSCIDDFRQTIQPLREEWICKNKQVSQKNPEMQNLVTDLDNAVKNLLHVDEKNQDLLEKHVQQLSTLKK